MRAPICVKCEREMKQEQVGILLEYINLNGSGEKIYADSYKCSGCGYEVVAGFANSPISRHFDTNYGLHVSDVRAREVSPT